MAKTGKSWKKWFTILDQSGATQKPHKDIARYIHDEFGISGWWSQMVTVRYEQERGLREVGQRRATGAYEIGVTRKIAAAPRDAYDAFTSAKLLNKWFTTKARAKAEVGGTFSNADGDKGVFTFLAPPRRVRFTWENEKHCPGTVVVVTFTKAGANAVSVNVTHSKLKSQKDRENMRGGWSWALDSLKSFLETGKPIRHEDWLESRRKSQSHRHQLPH
jgi:uncharacterized protein YndB with AHSA1/START domain